MVYHHHITAASVSNESCHMTLSFPLVWHFVGHLWSGDVSGIPGLVMWRVLPK